MILKLNDVLTDWFLANYRVRQLDTLFFIFINDSTLEIKSANYGVNIKNEKPQYYDYMLMILYYYDLIIILLWK